jgi:hypothetical protein
MAAEGDQEAEAVGEMCRPERGALGAGEGFQVTEGNAGRDDGGAIMARTEQQVVDAPAGAG